MSEAEFNVFWQEVQQESGDGPLAATFIASFSCGSSVHRSQVRYAEAGYDLFEVAGEYNFAMAA